MPRRPLGPRVSEGVRFFEGHIDREGKESEAQRDEDAYQAEKWLYPLTVDINRLAHDIRIIMKLLSSLSTDKHFKRWFDEAELADSKTRAEFEARKALAEGVTPVAWVDETARVVAGVDEADKFDRKAQFKVLSKEFKAQHVHSLWLLVMCLTVRLELCEQQLEACNGADGRVVSPLDIVTDDRSAFFAEGVLAFAESALEEVRQLLDSAAVKDEEGNLNELGQRAFGVETLLMNLLETPFHSEVSSSGSEPEDARHSREHSASTTAGSNPSPRI